MINNDDSQMSPLRIFLEGGGSLYTGYNYLIFKKNSGLNRDKKKAKEKWYMSQTLEQNPYLPGQKEKGLA